MATKPTPSVNVVNGNGRTAGVPMPTRNDLPSSVREKMVQLLQAQLNDTFDLSSHAKQAHWNVRGPHFMSLHLLFDQVHEAVEPYVDIIAERITALGGVVKGTVRMAAESTRLEEYPLEIHNGMDHVKALSDRLAALAKTTREAIDIAQEAGDEGTGDLFIDQVRDLDKYLWFVEAHLRAE